MYVVIVGGGKVGEYLADVLLDSDNEVVVIEKDNANADKLSASLEGHYMVIYGDGCDSFTQEDANVRSADIFVAATGQDDANLVACEIAQRVFNVPRCVARVNNPKNLRVFNAVGIETVSSTTLIASMIEEEALSGMVSVVSSFTHGNVILAELTVPHFKNVQDDEGIAISDIEMPDESIIIAVQDKRDMTIVDTDTVLYPGNKVYIAADSETMDEVRAVFRAL